MKSVLSFSSPQERLGEGSLYLFMLTAWVAPALANLALLLMMVACALTPRLCWRDWKQSPLFWLMLGWNLYLGAALAVQYLGDTVSAQVHLAGSSDFLKLSLFFVVGWWARGDERKLKLLLLVALAGVLLNTLKRVEWDTLPAVLQAGGRTGFGVQIPVAALLSSSVIVGLVGLQRSCVFSGDKFSPGRSLLWLSVLSISALIVFYTQTRTTWLTLVLLLPLMLFVRYFLLTDARLFWPRLLVFVGVLAAVFIGLSQSEIVSARIDEEMFTIKAILSGDAVPGGSVGLRYHAFVLGVEHWLQQPWLGWGAGFEAAQLNQEHLPSLLYHLHNTYLEFLVRFGVLGSVILLVAWLWLHRGLVQRWRSGLLSADLALTLVCLEVVFAVWSFTDFQIMRGYCQMYWFVLGGILLSLNFPQPPANSISQESPARV